MLRQSKLCVCDGREKAENQYIPAAAPSEGTTNAWIRIVGDDPQPLRKSAQRHRRPGAGMKLAALLDQVALGEDSTREFKADVKNPHSLAAEMAALANAEGGTIFIGVADDGSIPGLAPEDVRRINQTISNAASQHVRSALTVQTENVAQKDGRIVMALLVPKGADKPYFDKDGVIWLKTGADKRKINSREEVWRLFQASGQIHADEQPTKAGIDKLDKLRFRDFLHDIHGLEYPDSPAELTQLLQNLNLAADNGQLNLAGLLLFAEQPELIKPQFVVKAIRYPGNEIHATDYSDTEDFTGPLQKIYEDSLAFVMRNLHKVQAGRGVNAPGTPEIPKAVFEELLVNALVHRDYLVSAPIRLFIFSNRIEIISPGHLPNNLTVEKIRAGNSNVRNPTLVSYAAKDLLPHHGIGSGIRRAILAWPAIEFKNDVDGCLFTAVVHRKPVDELNLETTPTKQQDAEVATTPQKLQQDDRPNTEKILEACEKDRSITIRELAGLIGISERSVERNILKLQESGRLKRIGGKKHGHWHVPSPRSS